VPRAHTARCTLARRRGPAAQLFTGKLFRVTRYRGPERRAPERPTSGDLKMCPRCGDVMRFDERFTITREGVAVAKAAWICRNPACFNEQFVRAEDL